MEISKEQFFTIVKDFEIVPLTQSEGIYNFLSYSGSNNIIFLADSNELPTMVCMGHEKRFLGLKMLVIESECYKNESDVNKKKITVFYKELIESYKYNIIEVCSNSFYTFNYECAMRQAGFLRPVGQFSMPVTKLISLDQPIGLSDNWKKNLRKAGKYTLNFEPVDSLTEKDCLDFVRINNEMVERKHLRQKVTHNQIYELCKAGDFKLFFVSDESRERVAAIIIYVRKNYAGSWIAATSDKGLTLYASNFLYIQLMRYLKENNYLYFDLEKLVPSTKPVNNVFRFKNGISGDFKVLNGEWSWYKSYYLRPAMYFVKKFLMKKREI